MNRKDKIRLFWEWFAKHQHDYLDIDDNQDELVENMAKHLHKINSDLVFEIGPVLENGDRELVISADGISSLFPLVKQIVDSAPSVVGWTFVAFRQPHLDITELVVDELVIQMNDVFFTYVSSGSETIDIVLHIKGFYESAEWSAASFLILDTILGEYNTETYIDGIDTVPLDATLINNSLLPISQLPEEMNKIKAVRRN